MAMPTAVAAGNGGLPQDSLPPTPSLAHALSSGQPDSGPSSSAEPPPSKRQHGKGRRGAPSASAPAALSPTSLAALSSKQQQHSSASGQHEQQPQHLHLLLLQPSTHVVAGGSSGCGWSAGAMAREPALVVGSGAGDVGSALRMRLLASQALGLLAFKVHGLDSMYTATQLLHTLGSSSAYARVLVSLTLWHWLLLLHPPTPPSLTPPPAQPLPSPPAPPPQLLSCLHQYLSAPGPSIPSLPSTPGPYLEAEPFYAQMRREALALITACMQAGCLLHTPNNVAVEQLLPDQVLLLLQALPRQGSASATAEVAALQKRLSSAVGGLQSLEHFLHALCHACYSTAVVQSAQLPDKLNRLIQPLMASVRRGPELQLQELCASGLAELLFQCVERSTCPNDKVVRNLCAMAAWTEDGGEEAGGGEDAEGSAAVGRLRERQQSHGGAGPRGGEVAAAGGEDAAVVAAARVARLGGEAALRALCRRFGPGLWTMLPALWEGITGPLSEVCAAGVGVGAGAQEAAPPDIAPDRAPVVVQALQVLRTVGACVDVSLVPGLVGLLPYLCACCRSSSGAVRTTASLCVSALADAWLGALMPPLVRLLLPLLSSPHEDSRRGAVEVLALLVLRLGVKLVAYTVLLTVPMLRRMADPCDAVRRRASSCFGTLVALLPLAQGCATPPGLDDAQLLAVREDTGFLLQLLDARRVEDYILPVPLSMELRRYQQEGINWLAFLRRFGLHGVLADDMGLGKTLQAAAIMAAAHTEQLQQLSAAAAVARTSGPANGGSSSCPQQQQQPGRLLPSLILCPATLVAHWAYEISRYLPQRELRPLAYMGGIGERAVLKAAFEQCHAGPPPTSADPPAHNVLIMSYENCRADVDWLSSFPWLYCVLDEGHMIKNPKSKITLAVKRISATHRLLLSGTPIQNSVLELWSLFDFLMPGFLGPQRDFDARYGKALAAAKYSRKGSREAEAGLLAVDQLHKQVMPFVLRRTKAQVLSDLPPKVRV